MRVVAGGRKDRAVTSKKTSASLPSSLFGLLTTAICSVLLGLFFPKLTWHFLIIVSLSGALAMSDFIDVIRGRRDFFSPRSLVSLIMVIAVYVAPIVHICLDAYPKNINLPLDMVEALTNLALFHLAGVSLYFLVLRLSPNYNSQKHRPNVPPATEKRSYADELRRWMLILAVLSLGLFTYTVMYAGGPQAWFIGQLDRSARGIVSGAILSVAEAFPILFFIAYCLYLKTASFTATQVRNRIMVAVLLLVAITFITSGLRGSRANIVWPTLAALAIIHLLFFRIRLRILVVLALIGTAYAGIYDVYKKTGTEGLEQLQTGSVDSLNDYVGYGFGPAQLLLGDFSRTGVQAILLDRWNTDSFDPYLGVTYVGDAIEFIPGAESVEALPSKSVAGTDALYGVGSSSTRSSLSTRIYGIQGEALINFGPLGGILILIPYALLVNWMDRAYQRAERGSSIRPAIFVPLLLPATVLLFLSDFDNVLNSITSIFLRPAIAAGLRSITSKRKPNPRAKTSRKVRAN